MTSKANNIRSVIWPIANCTAYSYLPVRLWKYPVVPIAFIRFSSIIVSAVGNIIFERANSFKRYSFKGFYKLIFGWRIFWYIFICDILVGAGFKYTLAGRAAIYNHSHNFYYSSSFCFPK